MEEYLSINDMDAYQVGLRIKLAQVLCESLNRGEINSLGCSYVAEIEETVKNLDCSDFEIYPERTFECVQMFIYLYKLVEERKISLETIIELGFPVEVWKPLKKIIGEEKVSDDLIVLLSFVYIGENLIKKCSNFINRGKKGEFDVIYNVYTKNCSKLMKINEEYKFSHVEHYFQGLLEDDSIIRPNEVKSKLYNMDLNKVIEELSSEVDADSAIFGYKLNDIYYTTQVNWKDSRIYNVKVTQHESV